MNLCDICDSVLIFDVLCAFLVNLVKSLSAQVYFHLIQLVILFDHLPLIVC